MADVFISYSRKNSEFVERIHGALAKGNRDIWIDWEDIPLTANWWKEITEGIEAADTFIFVISPDALTSPVCLCEVAHALEYSKRIVPIVFQEVNENEIFDQLANTKLSAGTQEILGDRDLITVAHQSWATLARHNWLLFNQDTDFYVTFERLIKTLEVDLSHLKLHTRLLVRALEWERFQLNSSFLLTGDAIRDAEQWLHAADQAQLKPVPTDLHRAYLKDSRNVENSRQRLLRNLRRASAIAGVIGVGALIATIMALFGTQAASNRAAIAQAQVTSAYYSISTSTAIIGTQVAKVEQVQQDVESAYATLTPILPILTRAAEDINAAHTDVGQAQQNVFNANETATRIPSTLTQAANSIQAAGTQIGEAIALRSTSEAGVITALVSQRFSENQAATSIAQANSAGTQAAIIQEQLATATIAQGQALIQQDIAEKGAQTARDSAVTAQAQATYAHIAVATSTAIIGTQIADVMHAQQQVSDARATLAVIPATATSFAVNLSHLESTAVSLRSQAQEIANLSFRTVAQIYELEYHLNQEDKNYCPNTSLDLMVGLAEQFQYCQATSRNSLCKMQGELEVTSHAGENLDFAKQGISFPLSELAEVKMSPATGDDFGSLGIAKLNVQANLPYVLPGQAVSIYLIGQVGDVPPSVIAYDNSLGTKRCSNISNTIANLLIQGPQGLAIEYQGDRFFIHTSE